MILRASLYIIAVSMVTRTKGANPVVQTTLGPVTGLETSLLNKRLDVFYGIPYAKPPIGNLRFKRPESPEPWNETRATQTLPNCCHQTIDISFDRSVGVEMWNPNTPMSEDCLYLNVWQPKPDSSSEKLAVMVWIYGGTYSFGSITLDVYNGKYLAIRNNVVVVSMNYRIGVLGFLYLGNERTAPGNMGLLDQSLAMKWVYDNIEQFGGDKNRITLFGESAGAASVHLHLLSEQSRDYFSNAIMQSSDALCYWAVQSRTVSIQRARRLAKSVKCPALNDDAMFKCFLQTDARTLVTKQWQIIEYYFDVPFAPVVDGYFLAEDPQTLLKKGQTKNCSVILGLNKDEGSYFLLYGIPKYFSPSNPIALTRDQFLDAIKTVISPIDKATVIAAITQTYERSYLVKDLPSYRDILDDISGDRAFKCPIIDLARIHSGLGHEVYLYSYEYRPSKLPWPEWMGVIHGSELELVFGVATNGSDSYSAKDNETSLTMMELWSEFAKNGSGPAAWPKFSVENQDYLEIGQDGNLHQRQGLRHSQCTLWRELIPVLDEYDYPPTTVDSCVSGSRKRTLNTPWFIFSCLVSFAFQIQYFLCR
ncbi:cholinesterase 1-like [Gigantopelta aegis]|uniref:cholinesterase 1-like n=1 Tax=Gigantopelta aegis TaxID=1735272 RepID=UPI001B88A193|nr:cholinesterase 1-like [Gigantopelta aegis]